MERRASQSRTLSEAPHIGPDVLEGPGSVFVVSGRGPEYLECRLRLPTKGNRDQQCHSYSGFAACTSRVWRILTYLETVCAGETPITLDLAMLTENAGEDACRLLRRQMGIRRLTGGSRRW